MAQSEDSTVLVSLACGGLSGIASSTVTAADNGSGESWEKYMHRLVHTTGRRWIGWYQCCFCIWHALRTISREEGIFGLYKGLGRRVGTKDFCRGCKSLTLYETQENLAKFWDVLANYALYDKEVGSCQVAELPCCMRYFHIPQEFVNEAMDLSDLEKEVFSKVKTIDYYTTVLNIDELDHIPAGIYYFGEFMDDPNTISKPVAMQRFYPDTNIFLFWSYGNSVDIVCCPYPESNSKRRT
ncbi:hypothetical protein L1987_60056 [Smallanthus sonchifolius]|uniref:Uncharacterized protein n=1 Tax=Smallanthus sonchifolius TaxID=185202 RepID=A0ACB9D7T5_9ASTR|nr:hypothetical protein L1987_60056 [Smallanthus sonchifolius]